MTALHIDRWRHKFQLVIKIECRPCLPRSDVVLFSLGEFRVGRRHAFVRAGMAIPVPPRGPAAAHHRALLAQPDQDPDTTPPGWWDSFSAPSNRSVVVSESLSFNNINAFREMRQYKSGG